MITDAIARLLRRHGQTVSVHTAGGPVEVRAYVRLISNRSRETFQRAWSGIGEVPPGRVLYLGPPEVELSLGQKLTSHGQDYWVRRQAAIRLGDQVLYQWALLSTGGAA